MQENILNYLKYKYKPEGIILHGSRVCGMAREHSDWDFIFLYTKATDIKNGRDLFENQNIEFTINVLPSENIIETFNTKLQTGIVLYEEGNIATELLVAAQTEYAKGVHWPADKILDHKLWFEGRLYGMKDYVDTPEIFYKYYSDVYLRVFNYWYWLLRHSYSQRTYTALKDMETHDPVYYLLVKKLSSPEISLYDKYVTAEEIKNHLFR